MMGARGIQSVFSPSIRCPMLSNGLNVSGPSVPRASSGPRFCNNARSVPGVRSRTSIESRRLKSISSRLACWPLLPMDQMHDAVNHWCEEECRHNQKDAAGVEGENPGEHLARIRARRVHRSHAAEEHRGIQKSVAPGKALETFVT